MSALGRDIRSVTGSIIPGGIQTDAAINPGAHGMHARRSVGACAVQSTVQFVPPQAGARAHALCITLRTAPACLACPGNSGGPLLDSAGRVVGVNTAIFTPTGSSAGVGFAIPSATLRRIVPQLITYGRVQRGSLQAAAASDQVAGRLKVTRGAMIQSVTPGGAADKAGVLPTRRGLSGIVAGDVVLAVGTVPIRTAADLSTALEQYNPGQAVELTLARTGDQGAVSEMLVTVTLAEEQ